MTELPPAENKLCPFCNEQIKTQAIKCKHCRSDLEPVSDKQQIYIYNTITNETTGRNKPHSYLITPTENDDIQKTGHGLASIALSLVLFLYAASNIEEEQLLPEDLFIHIIAYEIIFLSIAVYCFWIIFQPFSNKILPIISLLISAFFMTILFNYFPNP